MECGGWRYVGLEVCEVGGMWGWRYVGLEVCGGWRYVGFEVCGVGVHSSHAVVSLEETTTNCTQSQSKRSE